MKKKEIRERSYEEKYFDLLDEIRERCKQMRHCIDALEKIANDDVAPWKMKRRAKEALRDYYTEIA